MLICDAQQQTDQQQTQNTKEKSAELRNREVVNTV